MDLDKEVDQMMKLAESASIATPSLIRRETTDSPINSLTPVLHHSPNLKSYPHQAEQVSTEMTDYMTIIILQRIHMGQANTDSPLLVSQRVPHHYMDIGHQRNFVSSFKACKHFIKAISVYQTLFITLSFISTL